MDAPSIVWTEKTVPLKKLKPYGRNPRKITPEGLVKLRQSIEQDGFHQRLVANTDGTIIGGHQRLKVLKEMGYTEVQVLYPNRELSPEEFDRINLRDNVTVGIWDAGILEANFSMDFLADMGVPLDIFNTGGEEDAAAGGAGGEGGERASLNDKFLVPPFSVLDARQGYWKERKAAWMRCGIKSELGREQLGSTVAQGWVQKGNDAGGSIFDPVLCEIAYRWFCPSGGTVLDCFAGGSVRGVVAAMLHRQYVGCELRGEQVEANRAQWHEISQKLGGEEPTPVWHQGDSQHIGKHAAGVQADLLFSCPPYADLEVYSKDPADISNMAYPQFLEAYRKIIAESCKLLKQDRFAVFVVGEVRGKGGAYHNFVGDTVQAFLDAGMAYYNEAVLVTPVGSLAIRAGRQFNAGRKLAKGHQNVLVFVKGDAKKATEACGMVDVELGAPDAEETGEEAAE